MEIKASIVEVMDSVVLYTMYDQPGGLTLSIRKSDIFLVMYKGGFREYYPDIPPAATDNPAAGNKQLEAEKKRKGLVKKVMKVFKKNKKK